MLPTPSRLIVGYLKTEERFFSGISSYFNSLDQVTGAGNRSKHHAVSRISGLRELKAAVVVIDHRTVGRELAKAAPRLSGRAGEQLAHLSAGNPVVPGKVSGLQCQVREGV